MLKKVRIRNFKSIENLSIDLGRFNVFIGENGCGKSNILEALIFPAAAYNNNIENDFLALRGARISDSRYYRNGFDETSSNQPICITLEDSDDNILDFVFENDNQPFSKWKGIIKMDQKIYDNEIAKISIDIDELIKDAGEDAFQRILKKSIAEFQSSEDKTDSHLKELLDSYLSNKLFSQKAIERAAAEMLNVHTRISDYLIYAPENFFLRNFNTEEVFLSPIGYRGEGLLGLINIIKKNKPEKYREIISHLILIDWFLKIDVDELGPLGEKEFHLMDKYLDEGIKYFDIRNSNEGFLFLLFYLTLFISDYTPKFFAIDNIDTALNPKLCSKLITLLSALAVKYDKQVIFTTHNPSILDGLNLNNDDERLFVISRNAMGKTNATRINKKPPITDNASVKLSEQFLRGYIGGLPKNF